MIVDQFNLDYFNVNSDTKQAAADFKSWQLELNNYVFRISHLIAVLMSKF